MEILWKLARPTIRRLAVASLTTHQQVIPMVRRMAKMDLGQSFAASLVTMDHH